jgi:hypothetical protein
MEIEGEMGLEVYNLFMLLFFLWVTVREWALHSAILFQ